MLMRQRYRQSRCTKKSLSDSVLFECCLHASHVLLAFFFVDRVLSRFHAHLAGPARQGIESAAR